MNDKHKKKDDPESEDERQKTKGHKKDKHKKQKDQEEEKQPQQKKEKKNDKEKRDEKEREKEKQEYEKLKQIEHDAYEQVDFSQPSGKIQVGDDDKSKKYCYYIVPLNEESQFYEPFDWKEKGIVRKRFEAIKRQKLIKKGAELKDISEKIEEVKEAVKGLEKLTGQLDDIRKSITDQYRKIKYLRKPQEYYKDIFSLVNPGKIRREQIDVRMMPPYYAHRKIKQALNEIQKYLRQEKNRKFKTTLKDHILYPIICDNKRIKSAEDKKEEEPVATTEGEKHFSSTAQLIHRMLADKFEYVFFTDESAKAEIGCFLVYISGLREEDD